MFEKILGIENTSKLILPLNDVPKTQKFVGKKFYLQETNAGIVQI